MKTVLIFLGLVLALLFFRRGFQGGINVTYRPTGGGNGRQSFGNGSTNTTPQSIVVARPLTSAQIGNPALLTGNGDAGRAF